MDNGARHECWKPSFSTDTLSDLEFIFQDFKDQRGFFKNSVRLEQKINCTKSEEDSQKEVDDSHDIVQQMKLLLESLKC